MQCETFCRVGALMEPSLTGRVAVSITPSLCCQVTTPLPSGWLAFPSVWKGAGLCWTCLCRASRVSGTPTAAGTSRRPCGRWFPFLVVSRLGWLCSSNCPFCLSWSYWHEAVPMFPISLWTFAVLLACCLDGGSLYLPFPSSLTRGLSKIFSENQLLVSYFIDFSCDLLFLLTLGFLGFSDRNRSLISF